MVFKYDNIYQFLKNFLEYLNRCVEIFATFILFLAVLVVLIQISGRSILGRVGFLPWVWESVIIFNVWIIYLGASVLSKDNKHITLKFHERFSDPIKSVLKVIVKIIILLTSSLVVVQVLNLVERQLRSPFVTIPFLKRGHVSVVILIGFAIIFIYTLFDLVYSKKKGNK